MENYSVYLPAYSIGGDIYKKIPEICLPYGRKAVVIGGNKGIAAVKTQLLESVRDCGLEILDFRWYGGEASYENVNRLAEDQMVGKADMIFAVGGGKALDTCKCLSVKTGKPVFTFPTIASTCAACTCVSIMYNPDGSFKEPFFFGHPPVHTFINTQVIASAPSKYIWAGMGDTYAKYFESTVSARGDELVHYHAVGVWLSRMCLDPILKYGRQAFEDNKRRDASYALEQTVLAIVVTTAIVSIFVTYDRIIDYNTGLAHAVYYALTSSPYASAESNHLHGEVVGFGVLILLLADGQREMFESIYAFNKSVGLPTKLSDIGTSADDLKVIIPSILKMRDIDHNPYKITETMLQNAFDELESYNKTH